MHAIKAIEHLCTLTSDRLREISEPALLTAEGLLSNLIHPNGASSRNPVYFCKDFKTWERDKSNRPGTGDMIT